MVKSLMIPPCMIELQKLLDKYSTFELNFFLDKEYLSSCSSLEEMRISILGGNMLWGDCPANGVKSRIIFKNLP